MAAGRISIMAVRGQLRKRGAEGATLRKPMASAVLLILAGALLPGEPAIAQTGQGHPPAPPMTTACGIPLNATVYAVWRDLGGDTGRLGCATRPENPAPVSPQGSAAGLAVFDTGEVVVHASGPRMGQAFAVVGCFYRLYVQFGGTSGWLGLPVSDTQNTPDGSRQIFEGGDMRYTRAYDTCEATASARSDGAGQAPAAADGLPLDLYENPDTGDRLSLASRHSVEIASAAGYRRLRSQARVLPAMEAGATPLKLYQDETRGLRRTLATPQGERDAIADGLVYESGQGFVWTLPRPGAVTLKLYRDAGAGAARLTAGSTDEAEAEAAGLTFQQIEGYAGPPP